MCQSSPSQPIKIYSSPLSGHAHRVWLMLSLLDLPTEVINVQMPDLKTPEFLAMSAFGQMPVIQDGDVPLSPYPAINAWLARIGALPGFVPMHLGGLATLDNRTRITEDLRS